MTEQPDNMVLEILRAIRMEMGELRAETNTKLGAMAQSMVSMRKDIGNLEVKIRKLDDDIQGLRADVRMIAIAVDEHTQRLDRIEAHYNPV